ncbi:unnamed protein product [Allacma fusca]|uniref:Uncharacterized protein n=1 Tax=Allacma fusca TaxID=39272 RepID=A0A8J2PIC1_9HEXA|nr:unnamed protein product [Allacma fusca]
MGVAAALSSELLSNGLSRKTYFKVIFNLFAASVEQSWDIGKIQGDTFKLKLRVWIVLSWLLTCLIMSNGYKGLLKTAFSTQNEFTTRWSQLDQIPHFIWYIPHGSVKNFSFGQVDNWNACSEKKATYSSRDSDSIVLYPRTTTKLAPKYLGYEPPKQYRCVEDAALDSTIKRDLISEETALVVPSSSLKYYWGRVKKVMEGKYPKFAHNGKINDPFLSNTVSIYLYNPFVEEYNYLGKRAHVAMASGLFWLWEKWDKIRFLKNDAQIEVKPEIRRIKALSTDSSLMLALYAFLWSSLTCSLVFIAEVALSLWDQRHLHLTG